jgi:hypothetical protein
MFPPSIVVRLFSHFRLEGAEQVGRAEMRERALEGRDWLPRQQLHTV